MLDLILILVLLTNLRLLALSRLGACIRTMAIQGGLLGLLPLFAHGHTAPLRVTALAIGSMVIKGIVFPKLLFRAVREAELGREVEPYVGFNASLIFGFLALSASFYISSCLPVIPVIETRLLVPIAIFGILCGLFLIIARKRAIFQALGFIALENGIFTFGAGVMGELSMIVEIGVLLDVFVAVFLMGIIIFHINREFDHIDTERLSNLKD